KGIETLVNAYAQADLDRGAWPLVLLGDGPLRAKIEALVKTHHLSSIQMPGFVDELTKTSYMKNARWIVVPPHTNEDLGLTALESRNLGVPCIITRDGGLPEAGGTQARLCKPRDSEALARLLEQAAGIGAQEYWARAKRTRRRLNSKVPSIRPE